LTQYDARTRLRLSATDHNDGARRWIEIDRDTRCVGITSGFVA
jgi:hypothetical protein